MGSAVLILLGTLLGVVLTRRGAVELERWRRREETMRLLRWAAELAINEKQGRRDLGGASLEALIDSPLVDRRDKRLVGQVATAAWRVDSVSDKED